jgi:hypothetical protein
MDIRNTDVETAHRRRMIAIAVAVGLSALVVAAAGGYAWWRSYQRSPQAAVSTIASAMMKRDVDAVTAHIDTTAVADAAVEDLLGMKDSPKVAEYLEKHAGASSDEHKKTARELLDGELREHVSDGTLPKRIPVDTDSLKALAASAYARRAVGSVRINGRVAHVTARVPFGGADVTVKFRMERRGDTWRVTKIENLHSVIKQLGY